mgnify:CR=1 FL=1
MSEENKEKNNKKTLSLKLGAKPSIPPLKSFESGKTVIVEKKRLRKSSSSQLQNNNDELNQAQKKETTHTTDSAIEENSKKSGVVLKPLSKDEQKKILKADSKEEKNKAISKIRGVKGKESNIKEEPNNIPDTKIKTENVVINEKKKEISDDSVEDFREKKKPSLTHGRKKFRERKVTIVTALSGAEERTRSLAAYKRAKQKNKKNLESEPQKKLIREVDIPDHITVKELANRMTEKSGDVIKSLMKMGMMATINENLDADTAELIVTEFGHKFKRENIEEIEQDLISKDSNAIKDQVRSPIVTIMGHVDHGKTSLLDKIRNTNVVSGESGGITQHIGAYEIIHNKNKITFIDTPGHAAFTDMRARGANVTDIVVLIVAADDGVMPQTKEAIAHAKSANVPIIVAINKCDKPEADAKKIKEQLLGEELIVEELSGDIQCVEVSAETGLNLDKLLDSIIVQAELMELKANYKTFVEATVIEANIDKGRGPICNVIITNGKLSIGDIAVAGNEYGKVRAILDDKGKNLKEACSSMPVQVLGFNRPPEAGDSLVTVENDETAKELCELRSQINKNKLIPKKIKNIDNDSAFGSLDNSKEIVEVVVKSDTRGSTEAIVSQIEEIQSEKVSIKVIYSGVGLINESDVALASASEALLLSFNTSATKEAKQKAKLNKKTISNFSIIYELIEYVSDYASGKLKPKIKENYLGKAEILKVFKVSKIGAIAGCIVSDGLVNKNAKVRVLRNDESIFDGNILSLKREKDEANEVRAGTECGIGIRDFDEFQVGDFIEVYNTEEIAQSL